VVLVSWRFVPVVTLGLATFCVGIGSGSMLCEWMSRHHLELGLVPLGSIGISVFAVDLAFSAWRFAPPAGSSLLTVAEFLRQPGGVHVLVDLFLIAVFSGFYTVPLMAFIQQRSAGAVRSRVIAGNNVLNALLMVLSSVVLMGMMAAGVSIAAIFLILALLNAVVATGIFTSMPEFWRRFTAWLKHTLRMRNEESE
jgi:hypothetical protein